jgi:hypothetical protein
MNTSLRRVRKRLGKDKGGVQSLVLKEVRNTIVKRKEDKDE